MRQGPVLVRNTPTLALASSYEVPASYWSFLSHLYTRPTCKVTVRIKWPTIHLGAQSGKGLNFSEGGQARTPGEWVSICSSKGSL